MVHRTGPKAYSCGTPIAAGLRRNPRIDVDGGHQGCTSPMVEKPADAMNDTNILPVPHIVINGGTNAKTEPDLPMGAISGCGRAGNSPNSHRE
ncbi:MAG: hypothetical protein ACOVP2_12235 [Armatimonadaceae bacterium]